MEHKIVPSFHMMFPEKGKVGRKSFKTALSGVPFHDIIKVLIKLDHLYEDVNQDPEKVKEVTLELFQGSMYEAGLHKYLQKHTLDAVTHEAAIQYVIMYSLEHGNKRLPESHPVIPQSTLNKVGECLLKAGDVGLDSSDMSKIVYWMDMQMSVFSSYAVEYRACVYWDIYNQVVSDSNISKELERRLGCSVQEYFCIMLSLYGHFCERFPIDKDDEELANFPCIYFPEYKKKLKNPSNVKHIENLILPNNYKPPLDNFYMHAYHILQTPLIKIGEIVVPISRKLLNRSLFDGMHYRFLKLFEGDKVLMGKYSTLMGDALEKWVLDLCKGFEKNVHPEKKYTLKKGQAGKTTDINILYPDKNEIILIEVKKTVPLNEETIREGSYDILKERTDSFFEVPTKQLKENVSLLRKGVIQWDGIERNATVIPVCVHHTTPLIMGANKCSYDTTIDGQPIEYMDIIDLAVIKNAVEEGKVSSFRDLILEKRKSKHYSWSDFLHSQGFVNYERSAVEKFHKTNLSGENVFYP